MFRFARIVIVLCILSLFATPSFAAVSGDWDGDGTINSTDLVCLLAYIANRTGTSAQIWARAGELKTSLATVALPTTFSVPSTASADFDGDGTINSTDLVVLLAYIANRTGTPAQIWARAGELKTSLATVALPTTIKLPNTTLGATTASGTAVTIDIQTQE